MIFTLPHFKTILLIILCIFFAYLLVSHLYQNSREGLTDAEKEDMIAKLDALGAEFKSVSAIRLAIKKSSASAFSNVQKNIDTVNKKIDAIVVAQTNHNAAGETNEQISNLFNYIYGLIQPGQTPSITNVGSSIVYSNMEEQNKYIELVNSNFANK